MIYCIRCEMPIKGKNHAIWKKPSFDPKDIIAHLCTPCVREEKEQGVGIVI